MTIFTRKTNVDANITTYLSTALCLTIRLEAKPENSLRNLHVSVHPLRYLFFYILPSAYTHHFTIFLSHSDDMSLDVATLRCALPVHFVVRFLECNKSLLCHIITISLFNTSQFFLIYYVVFTLFP